MIKMGKSAGLTLGIIVTLLGILWFYEVLYNWLWLGLVHSTSTGWIIGYALLFFIFVILTIVVIVLLALGYVLAGMVWSD